MRAFSVAVFAVAAAVAVQAHVQATAELQSRTDSPAAKQGQWEAGMDDDAGKAAATSQGDLPGADYEGARKIYPKRDRLYTTSLNGTWAFKLVNGLATPDELKEYAEIDGATLKKNLFLFLNEIAPVLEKTGIDMAIHPDDPPFPIFGIPRVVSCAADIREMVRACPSRHVGVTLCTGSLGANLKNDCVKIFREFHDRIHFCHFRNLEFGERGAGNGKRGLGSLVFRESDSHLVGNTDMPALMLELQKEESRRGHGIVVRPDHGRKLDIDKGRTCYYGYDYGGRLIGLSELRGLEAGIKFMKSDRIVIRRRK